MSYSVVMINADDEDGISSILETILGVEGHVTPRSPISVVQTEDDVAVDEVTPDNNVEETVTVEETSTTIETTNAGHLRISYDEDLCSEPVTPDQVSSVSNATSILYNNRLGTYERAADTNDINVLLNGDTEHDIKPLKNKGFHRQLIRYLLTNGNVVDAETLLVDFFGEDVTNRDRQIKKISDAMSDIRKRCEHLIDDNEKKPMIIKRFSKNGNHSYILSPLINTHICSNNITV